MDSCCCVYVDNTNEFHRREIRRARKCHKCCECGGQINIGEEYEYVAAKSEDGFWDVKTCLLCASIRDDLCTCGYYYGELRETIANCLGTDYITGEEVGYV